MSAGEHDQAAERGQDLEDARHPIGGVGVDRGLQRLHLVLHRAEGRRERIDDEGNDVRCRPAKAHRS